MKDKVGDDDDDEDGVHLECLLHSNLCLVDIFVLLQSQEGPVHQQSGVLGVQLDPFQVHRVGALSYGTRQ